MCWDGNSGSWREWDKTGRRRRFGYFGGRGGHSGNPKISGRVVRVLGNSGFKN
jgi:hypothetical protein